MPERWLKMEAAVSSTFAVPNYQLRCVMCKKTVLSLTQENAADFRNVVRCFRYKKVKIKFSHSSKHTGHYRT